MKASTTSFSKARPQWEICGEATNGQDAIDAAARLKPDIILLDITMPGMSGLEAASRISGLGLPSQILILTMHESGELAGDARRVGAKGYVTKSDAARNLANAGLARSWLSRSVQTSASNTRMGKSVVPGI